MGEFLESTNEFFEDFRSFDAVDEQVADLLESSDYSDEEDE
ncbi:hypothetical protein [Vibrio gigantis]|nr:hypothetical protein [Vibrio gigantis]